MNNFNSILYSTSDRVATITLNRSEYFNAIDKSMPGEIARAVDMATEDDSVHVIVITGSGRGFCGGYDLKQYAKPRARSRVLNSAGTHLGRGTLCGITT